MQLSYKTPIWLYPMPVDFRKQINGLVLLVSSELSLLPTSGELFLFRNRRGNQIKLLWYDGNGFWLCHKRLEKGRLCFPAPTLPVMELTHDELSWLLSGLDFKRHRLLPQISVQYFY